MTAASFHVFNSLTRQKELFLPIEPGRVRMYNCGPTVYGRVHVGNLRSFLFADVLRRWFEYLGYEVAQVMNVTDVGHIQGDADEGEDKVEARARAERVDPYAITREYERLFVADMEALGALPPRVRPRATEHVGPMLEMVEGLLERGYAYQVGENVYFDVRRFPRYGRLSGNRVEDLEAGARLEVNEEKRNPADFALWKSDPRHLMRWPSRFGPNGFPGWHIECSAMARAHLGDRIDVHTGGEDNVFPHHECEIAQSEAFTGQPFARYWMHARFLQVDGGKMSKSLGNVYTLEDVVGRGFEPRHLRFCLVRGHYRQPLNFTFEILAESRSALGSLDDFAAHLHGVAGDSEPDEEYSATVRARQAFEASLNDDLNMPQALAAMFTLRQWFQRNPSELTPRRAAAALRLLADADRVLACIRLSPQSLEDDIEQRIAARQAARARKDWAEADRIRAELAERGIVLEDSPQGVVWKRR